MRIILSLILFINGHFLFAQKDSLCLLLEYQKESNLWAETSAKLLGENTEELYVSPYIHIYNYTYHKQSEAYQTQLKRNVEFQRYLKEEKTIRPDFIERNDQTIINKTRVCFYKKVNEQKSFCTNSGGNSGLAIDTVVRSFDGYYIHLNKIDLEKLPFLRVKEISAGDNKKLQKVETKSNDGHSLALLKMLSVYTLDSSKLNYPCQVYFPVPAGNFYNKPCTYKLNKYSSKWELHSKSVAKIRYQNTEYLLIPLTETATFSIQYSIEKSSKKISFISPQSFAFESAILKTVYPQTLNYGEISADQRVLTFDVPNDFEADEISIELTNIDNVHYQVNASKIADFIKQIQLKTVDNAIEKLQITEKDLVLKKDFVVGSKNK